MSNSDLRRAWKAQQAQKQDVTNAIPALMGNGHGVVQVPNQPGYVYIRLGVGDLGQAYNNRCPLTDNLAIYVGYDPVLDPDRRIFQVLSVRMADYAGAGGTPTPNVPPHHLTHEYGGGDDVYVSWRRLMGFRVGRPSGFQVTVDEGVIIRAGAWLGITAQTLDLTALKPVGTLACYVLIVLNAAGVATATAGASVVVGVLAISDCPIPGAGEIPLAAVRLYGAQTSIGDVPTAPDIVDLRFPQSTSTGDVHLEDLSDYARGRIIRGGAADWEAYSAKTAGFIVQGDGTDVKSAQFDWDVFSAGAGADMVHNHTSNTEGGTLPASAIGAIGGQEPFHVDGTLAVLADVCDTFISPVAQSIDSVYIKCSTKGSASSTIVDAHRNGGTIFTTTANRPTLAYNGGDYAKSGTPDIVDLNEGDLVTFDIDQVATGAAKLSILLLLAAAISNVPQQGVLDASKIGAGTDNIVLALGGGGAFDSSKILHPCAVEWGGTVYLFYTGYDGATYKIGVATAATGGFTGLGFSKSGSNPILSPGAGGSWDDGGVMDPWVIYDSAVGLWKMWYRGISGGVDKLGYATASSPTGTWTKSGSNPIMSPAGWEGSRILLPSVLKESATSYKMLYAGNEPFSANGRIGLATSTDGIAWTKYGSNPVLSPSGVGWMAASVFSPRTLIKVDSTYYLYFSAKPTAVGLSKSGAASSTDLHTWALDASNPLLSSTRAWEGGVAGETENPNFLRLGHDYYVFYDAYEGSPATIGVVKITV